MKQLENKIAIVTGGTRGIGFSTVEAFLQEGATVILCGSRPESAEKAVQALKVQDPAAKVEGISPELSDYASVKAAFDAASLIILPAFSRVAVFLKSIPCQIGISSHKRNPILSARRTVY